MIQMVTPYDIKLVFVQKITFVLGKINKKTTATRAALFGFNMHQMVCRFTADPIGGAYSAPPDPLAVFREPIFKGRGEEKGEEEGSSSFALGTWASAQGANGVSWKMGEKLKSKNVQKRAVFWMGVG